MTLCGYGQHLPHTLVWYSAHDGGRAMRRAESPPLPVQPAQQSHPRTRRARRRAALAQQRRGAAEGRQAQRVARRGLARGVAGLRYETPDMTSFVLQKP